MAAALVNQPAQLLLAMTEIGDQSLKALRLCNRVEIGALDVFNQRKLEARGIVKFADDRRNLVKSRRLRRPPTPLAGNDFISPSLVDRPHQDRLENTLRADRPIGRASCRERVGQTG